MEVSPEKSAKFVGGLTLVGFLLLIIHAATVDQSYWKPLIPDRPPTANELEAQAQQLISVLQELRQLNKLQETTLQSLDWPEKMQDHQDFEAQSMRTYEVIKEMPT